MAKFTLAKALALASIVGLAAAQDSCGRPCIDQMASNMGCPGDMACACAMPDFTNAIQGCVRDTCNDGVVVIEDVVAAITGEAEGLCAAAGSGDAEGAKPTDPADPAATDAADATKDPAATEDAAKPTETGADPAATDDAAAAVPTTTEQSSQSEAPQSTSTGATTSETDAAAAPVPTKGSDDEDDDEEDDSTTDKSQESKGKDDEEEEKSAGLSAGAKAGIGIGVSVAGLALIGTVVLLLLRRRRAAARPAANFPRYNISGAADEASAEAGTGGGQRMSEFRAKRYEDMIPRVAPTSAI